jgi:hypothetical protein
VTHKEFDRLMNAYFDGNIDESESRVFFDELSKNSDRKKLFDRLSLIYEKAVPSDSLKEDSALSDLALSDNIKPSSRDSEIIQSVVSGSMFSEVNSSASRTWKGYTEDNYAGRIFAVFITILIALGLYIIDRQWAKSIEENKKIGALSTDLQKNLDNIEGNASYEIDQLPSEKFGQNDDFYMSRSDQYFFMNTEGLDLAMFRNSREQEKSSYVEREKKVNALTESISRETGTYIFSIQRNMDIINRDIKDFSHSVILII